jgi:type 1 fimbriae regulatory protein FimB
MGKQSLDREQLLALLRAAKAKRERDYLMIWLAFCHGLRASEVVALRPDNFDGEFLTVQRLKGSLKTTQRLAEHADPLLNGRKSLFDFVRLVRGNQRLFPITREWFWHLVQEHGKTAGIPKHLRHPHILKHSIAMQTIETAGIQNVRQHLGHKSISSTGEYLKVTDAAATAAVQGALAV